jgi:hypothetical protein
MNVARLLVAAAALSLAAACTGVSVERRAEPELEPLRAGGYRIAVMPFTVSAPEDGFLIESLAPVGELLVLEDGQARPMREQLGELLSNDVVAWLQQSEFEVMDAWYAGTRLGHAGYSLADKQERKRVQELAKALEVDGILFGDVRAWNRSYYVVQSIAEVRLQIELIDGGTGKSLFTTDRTETIGSGITGGPTGYVSAATEPLAGLRGSHLRSLTRSVTRNVVTDLNGGALGNQPGPTSPRLSVVALAKEHDGPFRQGERVDVIAIGTPGCDVRFDVGRLRIDVPMRQTAMNEDTRGDRATYLGHYVVDTPDLARELPVLCTIQRSATRRTVAARYRWEGTVSLDGSAR